MVSGLCSPINCVYLDLAQLRCGISSTQCMHGKINCKALTELHVALLVQLR